MKTLLAAFALAAGLAPAVAYATCTGHDRQAQISCAEGQTWDAETRTCVTVGS
ncbi:hypothetical protein DEA8626_01115 [Defluviimonas aquaemixtae]|uniref:Chitin-binding type-2 domain-containing protein n=1 Tax=Albidovulum aquaemixtae TaxID=1542388 RepID=A0A2R8B4W5_9RHOB|nr:adenylosuccinate lyase [Defluviimonas aquaemixtae]SPH17592.1 hypothetical protein DEA8626_01115 [Defluviimonas aquaemixtae]